MEEYTEFYTQGICYHFCYSTLNKNGRGNTWTGFTELTVTLCDICKVQTSLAGTCLSSLSHR